MNTVPFMHSRNSSKIYLNMTTKILVMCWPSKTVSSIQNLFKKNHQNFRPKSFGYMAIGAKKKKR